jgi:hypothetical protein
VYVFIIMLLPTVPDPDAVLAHLQPVCQSVWQALEVGVGAAHQYAVEEQPIGYALTAAPNGVEPTKLNGLKLQKASPTRRRKRRDTV